MEDIIYQLERLFPALAFLIFGVPLAILLDKIGFFRASADVILHRKPSLFKLWLLAAATTAILNLDTTIVLLTPLYVHIAKKAKVDPIPIVVIPLLLACFGSSFLPVSNLTNLIAAGALGLSVLSFVVHLWLPSIIAVGAGWLLYRRRFMQKLGVVPLDKEPDARALKVGGGVVFGVLVGFVLGPLVHLEAWMVALLADVVLIAITRTFPWRSVPLKTALIVAVVGCVAAFAVPKQLLAGIFTVPGSAMDAIFAVALGTLGSNLINNLPTTLIGVASAHGESWGLWGWIIGVNVGAALLPIGAVANLLWWSIVKRNGIDLPLRQYLKVSVPIGLPVLLLAALTLVAEKLLFDVLF